MVFSSSFSGRRAGSFKAGRLYLLKMKFPVELAHHVKINFVEPGPLKSTGGSGLTANQSKMAVLL